MPNHRHRRHQAGKSIIFPVFILPVGDDGKRKAFHVLHCLHQPHCVNELKLAVGKSRLPDDAIVRMATQKGWHCDRQGHVLCPFHIPGRAGKSRLPPDQRRAAFAAIRQRELAAANDGERRAAPSPRRHKPNIERLKLLRLLKEAGRPLTKLEIIELMLPATGKATEHRLRRLTAAGQIIRTGRCRAYLYELAPATKEEEMPETSEAPPIAQAVKAEPPRQPTRDENKLILDKVELHYDRDAGRWCGDWSDQKLAAELKMPRAWISRIRDLIGEDVSEASLERDIEIRLLLDSAAHLKDDALAIATRAEALERMARKALGS